MKGRKTCGGRGGGGVTDGVGNAEGLGVDEWVKRVVDLGVDFACAIEYGKYVCR